MRIVREPLASIRRILLDVRHRTALSALTSDPEAGRLYPATLEPFMR